MVWMFEEEAINLLEKSEDCYTWAEGVKLVLSYVQQNASVCLCALESKNVGRPYLQRLMFQDAYAIMNRFIAAMEIPAKKDDQEFIATFYTQALVTSLIHWLENGMKQTPDEMIELLDITMNGAIKAALERSAARK